MKYLKLSVNVLYQTSPMSTDSPYVTAISSTNGFSLDVILPWHARLYRAVWYRTYPNMYNTMIPVTTCTISNMGNVQFNNAYEGMRVKEDTSTTPETYTYIYAHCCNDIPNTTVYNEPVAGGYLNHVTISFYEVNGNEFGYSGYAGNLILIYCFDDNDPTYDDMLANCSPSSAISVVAADWSLTERGYQSWYIKNDGTLPYLKSWESEYSSYKLYFGDEPIDKLYFRENIAKLYLGDLEL